METSQAPGHTLEFEKLSERVFGRIYTLAMKLTSNHDDAEDLTQDSLVRAFRHFDKYQGDKPFENWVMRIMQRLFLDLLRHRKRRVKTISSDAPLHNGDSKSDLFFEMADLTHNPEIVLFKEKLGEELQAALSGLTPDQQYLVAMADLCGHSYTEISEELKIPIGTIRSRLHRARKSLRTRVEAWERTNPTHPANLKLTARQTS